MIDKEIIEAKIDIITENLRYLHKVAKIREDAFAGDFEKIQATKHSLQEAIEACLDIANHIIAAKGLNRAEEYGQFFTRLAEADIINKKLAKKLAKMAKFRNLLVHRYSEISTHELHHILKEDLTDIDEYTKEILKHTSRRKTAQP